MTRRLGSRDARTHAAVPGEVPESMTATGGNDRRRRGHGPRDFSRGDGGERNGEAGYLLVEALATLTLAALLLGGLLALGGGLSRVADRIAGRVEATEAGRLAVAAMARDIAQLSRRRFPGAQEPRFAFYGQTDRIVFVVEAPQQDGLARPVVVAYQADGPGAALRAEGELPVDAQSLDDVALSRPHRMPFGDAELRFAFVERLKSGGELVTDAWSRSDLLPAAIRIDRLDPASKRLVASRRVAIVAETEPGCAAAEIAFCSTKKKPRPGAASPDQPGPQQGGPQPDPPDRG